VYVQDTETIFVKCEIHKNKFYLNNRSFVLHETRFAMDNDLDINSIEQFYTDDHGHYKVTTDFIAFLKRTYPSGSKIFLDVIEETTFVYGDS
jgi:hypothetical protein